MNYNIVGYSLKECKFQKFMRKFLDLTLDEFPFHVVIWCDVDSNCSVSISNLSIYFLNRLES